MWFCTHLVVSSPIQAQPSLTQEQAVALAVRFVRENGYTDASADQIKAQLDFESVELAASREELLASRRKTLQAKAIGAKTTSSAWGVAFGNFDPQSTSCRVVEMQRDGSKIRVMHQDGIREYWAGFETK